MKISFRSSLSALILGISMVPAAYSMPIEGTFTLVEDSSPYEIRFSGSFITEDVTNVAELIGPRNNPLNTRSITYPDALRITGLSASGVDPSTLDPITYAFDPAGPNAATLWAILLPSTSAASGFTVAGLYGDISSGPNLSTAFRLQEFPGSDGTFSGNFQVTNTNGSGTTQLTGRQAIPEPAGLALLGIGVVAFGAARRQRTRSASRATAG